MLIECGPCGATVNAEAVASYVRQVDENDYPDTINLLKCPLCQNPILISVDDVVGDGAQLVLYPSTEVKASASVPQPIRQSFDEAVACLRAKAFTAAAIMCRKTLEGLCSAHKVKDRGLLGGLRELRGRGVIESRLFEWADQLRIQGNEAAHDLNVTTSPEDARDIVEFTHALLEYVFTFNDKFESFKKRRSKTPGKQ